MFVADTNVLVYAADEESPHHGKCRRLVEQWRSQASAWFVTWPILYEFLRVTTHPRVFRAPWPVERGWSFVEALLASPSLEVLCPTARHAQVAAEVFRELPHVSGNLVHDAHIAVLMREHGVRLIYTRNTDFHRFAFLEPRDPLAV